MNNDFENDIGNWTSEDEAMDAQELYDSYRAIRNYNVSEIETLKHLIFLEIQLNRMKATINDKNKRELLKIERKEQLSTLLNESVNFNNKIQDIRDALDKKYPKKISFITYKSQNKNLQAFKHLSEQEWSDKYRDYWLN